METGGWDESRDGTLHDEVAAEVEEAVRHAEESPYPDRATLSEHRYAGFDGGPEWPDA